MASGARRNTVGSFVSDGALRSVQTVDYRPTIVKVFGENGDHAFWNAEMPDDSMILVTAAGAVTMETSDGIIPLANGFSLGANADMNASGEVIYWEASE